MYNESFNKFNSLVLLSLSWPLIISDQNESDQNEIDQNQSDQNQSDQL